MSNIPKYIRVMKQRKYDLNKVLPKLIQRITNKNQSNNECNYITLETFFA